MKSDVWTPFYYNRYLDDLIIIAPKDEEKLKQFFRLLNNSSKSLKFKFELSDKEISFLDLTVKKFNGKYITSSFEKPTNKHILRAIKEILF